jgi:hypothetical protein
MHLKPATLLALIGVFLTVVAAAAASPKPLSLRARLIQRDEFPGFRVEPGLARYRTAALWVQSDPKLTTSQRATELSRLRHEGFRGLDQEFLDHGKLRLAGVSWVMRLGSPAAARAELGASLETYKREDTAIGATFTPFTVHGISGARGFELSGNGEVGDNVFFADGPYLYLIGDGWSLSATDPPTRASLLAAAHTLHARVHGRPAP